MIKADGIVEKLFLNVIVRPHLSVYFLQAPMSFSSRKKLSLNIISFFDIFYWSLMIIISLYLRLYNLSQSMAWVFPAILFSTWMIKTDLGWWTLNWRYSWEYFSQYANTCFQWVKIQDFYSRDSSSLTL